MDEVQAMLKAILGGLEEVRAEVKGLGVRIESLEKRGISMEAQLTEFRSEVGVHLDRIEGRLDYLTLKWADQDLEIQRLKRQQK